MDSPDSKLQYPPEVPEEADSSSPAPSSDAPRIDRSAAAPPSHNKRRPKSLPRQRHHRRAVPASHSEIDLIHGFGPTVTDTLRRDVQILDAFEQRFAALRTQLVEATASLSAHKLQLQNAKMELQRAEGIIADVDRQRIEAEVQAAKDRATTRRLLIERKMNEAKEQGYREGYEEGFGMVRSFREIRRRKRSERDREAVAPLSFGRATKSSLSVSILADYEDLEEQLKVPVNPNPMVAVMRSVVSSFANPPDWQTRRTPPDRHPEEPLGPASVEPAPSPSPEDRSASPSPSHSDPPGRFGVSPEPICPIPTQIHAPSPLPVHHSPPQSQREREQSLERVDQSTSAMGGGAFQALTRSSKFSPHIDVRRGESRASTPLSQYAMLKPPPPSEPERVRETERMVDEWRSQNMPARGPDVSSRLIDWEFVSPVSEASYHASSLYHQTDPGSRYTLGEAEAEAETEQPPTRSPPKRLKTPFAWLRRRFQQRSSSTSSPGVNIEVQPPSQSPSNRSDHTMFNPGLLTPEDRPLPGIPLDLIELPDDRLPPGFIPILQQADDRFSPIPQVPMELAPIPMPMRRPATPGRSAMSANNTSPRSRAASLGGYGAPLHRPISLFSDS